MPALPGHTPKQETGNNKKPLDRKTPIQVCVQHRFPMYGAECKPFGADDFDVADAEEGEDRAQILLLEVVSLERHSRCVKTAARRGDDHTLTAGQPDWPVRSVAEGFAGDRDAVDPCLELARDTKIIHRCADD